MIMNRLYQLFTMIQGAQSDVDNYVDGKEDGHVDGSGTVVLRFHGEINVRSGCIGEVGGRRGAVGVVVEQAVGVVYSNGVEVTQDC